MHTSHEFQVNRTFNIQAPDTIRVLGQEEPGPLTPSPNAGYRFRPSLLSDVLAWHRGICAAAHHDGLWVTGPMGSGKSSLVREVAARLNLNVVEVNGQGRMEIADLVGYRTAIGGDVLFQDGPLTRALRHGWWLLINEVDLIDPAELAGLNTILDGGSLVIPENGGEIVRPAPGFGLICTANTAGLGDSSGSYLGTRRMNAALLDRFWVIQADYPSPEEEINLLTQGYPTLPLTVIQWMVAVAGEVRQLYRGEGPEGQPTVEVTFSTRTLLRWAGLTLQFKGAPSPLHHALRRTLTNRAEPETAEAIHQLVQRITGEAPHG